MKKKKSRLQNQIDKKEKEYEQEKKRLQQKHENKK